MAPNHIPLRTQVTRAEQRVLQRRRMVSLRATRLRHALSEQLRAPATLLWAAGAGFVTGELMQHRKSAADESDSPDASGPSLFSRALHWSAIARSVIAGLASNRGEDSN